jgi:hypothetical protein
MAVFPPYQLRHLPAAQTEFRVATNNARCARWLPVLILLSLNFSDYEIGLLLGLREEYENGVERKG